MNAHLRIPPVLWYALLGVVFAVLVLLPGASSGDPGLQLESWMFYTLSLVFAATEAIIWFAAFYGASQLGRYARLIHSSPDGQAISRMARGLLWFAIGLPAAAILATALSIITTYRPEFRPASVIINTYITTAFPLVALFWISAGARKLGELSKTRPPLPVFNLIILVGVVLGAAFCAVVSLNQDQLRTIYHLSPTVVIFTIGVPYIYTWFLGLFAIAELRAHSQRVRGLVYRKSWRLLSAGITGIILMAILLQYATALSVWLTLLPPGWVLLLLYVLLLLLALAFIVVALGALRLAKIEEV